MEGREAPDSGHVANSRTDRARSLDSLHDVERMASAPGPPRPEEWRDDLLLALEGLAASLVEQYERSSGPESLLADIVESAPHLASAVTELRAQQAGVGRRLDELRYQLADLTRPIDVPEIRDEISSIAGQVHDLRAWETDLVYEAYSVDLGVGD